MAIKVLNKDSTATDGVYVAADWDSVTNTPTIHATTNVTNLGVSVPKYTATFTAPNTTNACTGVWLYIAADYSASVSVTATLYENAVATACTKTIIPSTVASMWGWYYIRFSTPYVFTSTTAGYYSFGFLCSSGGVDVAADAGGSLIAFVATDDRTGAPGASDDLWISSGDTTDTVTLTLSGTNSWGSGTDRVYAANSRTVGAALIVGKNGKLVENYATTNATTISGKAFVQAWGEWHRGSVANPIAQTSTLTFSMSATNNGGAFFLNYAKYISQGLPKTYYKTLYVSGAGTAASPMITADTTGWSVNDQVFILGTSDNTNNYLETEKRFIKTISGTSITLSTTAGGAEAGLTYTHTTAARILNVTRNVITNTNNNTYFCWFRFAEQNETGYVDIDWSRFYYTGASAANALYIARNCAVDYTVSGETFGPTFYFITRYGTYTGNIGYEAGSDSTTTAAMQFNNARGSTFIDHFSVLNNYPGVFLASCYACTFNGLVVCSAGQASTATYGIYMSISSSNTFNDLEVSCLRGDSTSYGAIILTGCSQNRFNRALIGVKGAVKTFLNLVAATYNTENVFSNCTFGTITGTFINNYLLGITGSSTKFHVYNNTDSHFAYFPEGITQSTGTGLTDTTARTAGGFAIRFEPMSSTDNFEWKFTVPTGNIQNKTMTVACWVKINNADYYSGTHQKPRLVIDYDNGTEVYAQATETTDWQQLIVNFTPATTYGQITVKITGRTDQTTTKAYFYVDDFAVMYPAGVALDLGTLDNWADALPVVPPLAIPISAYTVSSAVWEELTASHTTTGSMGKKLKGLKNPSALLGGSVIV